MNSIQENSALNIQTVLSVHVRSMHLGGAETSATSMDPGYVSAVFALLESEPIRHGGAQIAVNQSHREYSFPDAISAINCAVGIQRHIDGLNEKELSGEIYLLSIGLSGASENSGLAKFLSDTAGPGEINLSESVYKQLMGKTEIFCRFTKQLSNVGDYHGLNVYEAFPNPSEVEVNQLRLEGLGAIDPHAQPARSFGIKLIISILIALSVILVLMAGYRPVLKLITQFFSR